MSEIITDFADVEALMLAVLRAAMPYAPTVETYAGNLQDVAEGRFPLTKKPAVFVVFDAERFESVDGPQYLSTMTFVVVIVASSLREADESRTGEYGAYRMVRDVKNALINVRLADNLDRLKPEEVILLLSTRTDAAYQIGFSVTMDQTY